MEPTTPQNLAIIKGAIDGIESLMLNLYSRWQDEKDFEDIRDYAVPIKRALPATVTMGKMTKRPFGFEFFVAGNRYSCFVGRNYGWKRVA